MNESEPMPDDEQNIIEKKVRHATGISALRKIGRIVAEEQRADAEKEKALRWFARYGWVIAAVVVLLFAFFAGLI